MRARSPPIVVLLSGPGTLEGVDSGLEAAGVRLIRIASFEPRPVAPRSWLRRVPRDRRVDTVVVTSRVAVTAGVIPWRELVGSIPASVEFWAAGPGTANALRQIGIGPVHQPRGVGAMAVASGIRRKLPRTVVYFRSNAAGPALGRRLRGQGHLVTDLVVYRLEFPPPLTVRERRLLFRAKLLVATSPSTLSSLRRRLDRPAFARLLKSGRLTVLGERSRRAACGHGFRQVSVAPSTNAQRLTRHLLQELVDASR